MSDIYYLKEEATHIVFLLDASGSMCKIRDEAIELFNHHVNEVRRNPSPKTTVSFATFGTESRPLIHYVGQPLERLEKLTAKNYIPDGMTPLNDCIGKTCERVEHELVKADEDTAVLVIIVTDGLENYSGRWQTPEDIEEWRAYSDDDIKKLITRLEATGDWTFTFLGANQSKEEISHTYGIQPGNIQIIEANPSALQTTTKTLGSSTARYLARRKTGGKRSSHFFDEDATKEPST